MNENHRRLCASAEWGEYIRDELLPWVIGDRSLGETVLEIGPGPGLTTDLLRTRTAELVTVDADPETARSLVRSFEGTNVTVIHADATDLPFPAARFTAAVAMTMLHHVPTSEGQDRLFAEVRRVLRPGGWFVGEDSLDDPGFREFHEGDVCVPVDPETLGVRLAAAGFNEVDVERGEEVVRFAARVTAG